MYYSPGKCFEKILVNVEKAKSLTKRNQLEENKGKKRYQCRPNKHLKITLMGFPVGITFRRAKISTLDVGISKYEAKKVGEG